MKVTRNQVEEMAALARLRLSEREMDRLAGELGDILGHAADLAGADEGVAAGPGSVDDGAPLRADVAETDALGDPPSAIAPEWVDGFFTVPRLEAMKPGGPEEQG